MSPVASWGGHASPPEIRQCQVSHRSCFKISRKFSGHTLIAVARLTARRYANAVYTLALYQSSRLSASFSCERKCRVEDKATNRTQMPAPHRDALLYILMIALVVQDSRNNKSVIGRRLRPSVATCAVICSSPERRLLVPPNLELALTPLLPATGIPTRQAHSYVRVSLTASAWRRRRAAN